MAQHAVYARICDLETLPVPHRKRPRLARDNVVGANRIGRKDAAGKHQELPAVVLGVSRRGKRARGHTRLADDKAARQSGYDRVSLGERPTGRRGPPRMDGNNGAPASHDGVEHITRAAWVDDVGPRPQDRQRRRLFLNGTSLSCLIAPDRRTRHHLQAHLAGGVSGQLGTCHAI